MRKLGRVLSFSAGGGWCGGAGSPAYSVCTGGGLFGSKRGIGVGRNLRIGGSSCLGASTLWRFPSLCAPARSLIPVATTMSGGGGGGAGGGKLGGLADLPRGAVAPSPGWEGGRASPTLFPMSASKLLITLSVLLIAARVTRVSLERSLGSEFLLIRASSHFWLTSTLW